MSKRSIGATGTLVAGMSHLGESSVGVYDKDRDHITLRGLVEEKETLNVQSVDLVGEQHSRHELCFAFLPQLSHLGIVFSWTFDLISPVSPEKRAKKP